RQPRCADIAQPRDLRRRWSGGKRQQPLARVSHQVDQHVDFVRSDLPGKLFVGEAADDTPNIRCRAETDGVWIFKDVVRVTNDRASTFVEALHGRQRQKGDWMLAKVFRNE